MGITQKVTINNDLEDDDLSPSEHIESKKNNWKGKNGTKSADSPKPKGAIRVTTEGKIKTNRPKLVYKERVVDSETGQTEWRLWWMTEQSDYHGLEELIEFNPRTEARISKGFDYTIPFTVEAAKKLIKESFGGTAFYIKDGVPTYEIAQNDLDEVFLKDFVPKITPKSN